MKLTDLIPRRHRDVGLASDDTVSSFRSELNRLFDDFFVEPWRAPGGFSPTLDVTDTDNAIEVKAELPGMDEKDVEVLLDESALTIRGEKKDELERTENGTRIKESSYGKFERTIPLSVDVDLDKVDAKYKKGVLRITLPKTEKARESRRRIPVKG